MSDVCVVGAGPAGLTAALAAARAGHSVTVLDAADRVGGMAASIEVAGQRVDLGSHRLHPAAPAPVRTLLHELLGDDLQIRQRNGRVRLAGRWIPFPFTTGQALSALGPGPGARLVADMARAGLTRRRLGSYADVIRSGLGHTSLEVFHGPMATKLWGRPPDDLAGELALRRVAVRSPMAVARRMLRTRRPDGRTFLYPRLGYGQIVERLADAADAAGVAIRMGTRPVAVLPGDDAVTVTTDDATHRVGRVLWTAPLAPLAAAVGDAAREGEAHEIGHRGMVLVYTVVDGPRWQPVDAHYVPDPAVPFSRISEPKNYRDGPDPEDRSVVCFEIPCDVDDERWRMDADGWSRRLDRDLATVGLPPVGDRVEHIARLPRVYPVYGPDDVAVRAGVSGWSHRLPGITVFGRQGLVVGDNLHHVMDMGLAAAACIDGHGRWDADRWSTELARFDRFVVED